MNVASNINKIVLIRDISHYTRCIYLKFVHKLKHSTSKYLNHSRYWILSMLTFPESVDNNRHYISHLIVQAKYLT